VFGVSFTELMLIGAVALMVVGPQRLPKMLGTLGRWTAKLRRITTEVRYQSGIDEILRKEGFSGGLNELKQLQNVARGGLKSLVASTTAVPGRPNAAGARPATPSVAPGSSSGNASGPSANLASAEDPYSHVPYDRSREYPSEGCDCAGALPDDLWSAPLLSKRPPAQSPKPAVPSPAVATESPPKAVDTNWSTPSREPPNR
jgi:sec-independent protein translocase protein TatB